MRTCVFFVVFGVAAEAACAADNGWGSQILLESEHGIGGAAIGDLHLESPGNEVVAVNAAGEVWLVRRGGAGWFPQRIHNGDGEMIMCAIGDVDPRFRGNEFVGVGMVSGPESRDGPGQALLIRGEGDGWLAQPIFVDDHMLHGVAIGDVSDRHEGNEVVVCGFNHRVTLLSQTAGSWKHETIYVGNDRMKIVLIDDVVPERPGQEVLVCGSDGRVVVLWESDLGWRHEVVFSDPYGQSRIAMSNLGILVGGDKGKVTLVRRRDGRWGSEHLFRDSAKMRGVAAADIDRAYPGEELYACGYSRRIVQLLTDENGFWRAKVVFEAERPLHHLLAGEFDPTNAGLELVTCGHGGRLIALFPE